MAREIISNDRCARNYGRSQNIIGEIERALVEAYKLGNSGDTRTTVSPAHKAANFLNWIEIPIRSRDTLSMMTLGLSTIFGLPDYPFAEIEKFYEDEKPRWALIQNGAISDRTMANGSVAPLIRLRLIEPISKLADRFSLTQLGIATAEEYWRRYNSKDKTLPKIGVRW